MWPFGFSDEEQRRITELRTAWQVVAVSGFLVDPEVTKLYREDIAKVGEVLEKADKGEVDIGDLTGAEISARRVMWAAHEKTRDPRFAPDKRPQGGDLERANPGLRAAAAADNTARAVQQAAGDAVSAIPLKYKVGGALALVILLLILVKR